VGLDISRSMLEIAAQRDVGGDLILNDIGQGFGFRSGLYDGAISISAIQWLCYNDKRDHRSAKRLTAFFQSLYKCLRRGGRCVLGWWASHRLILSQRLGLGGLRTPAPFVQRLLKPHADVTFRPSPSLRARPPAAGRRCSCTPRTRSSWS
jgi:SAM-dependent methyltransferase